MQGIQVWPEIQILGVLIKALVKNKPSQDHRNQNKLDDAALKLVVKNVS
jgi:hypothetical protein